MIINKETRPLLENMDGTKKARSGLKCEIEVSKKLCALESGVCCVKGIALRGNFLSSFIQDVIKSQ